jgi:transposase InsO family protein
VEGLGEAGLERLLTTLEDVGAGKVALTIDDARPDNAAHLTRLCLQGAAELGWSFDQAWSTAMARLQPSQAGGQVDPVEAAELREDRRLLEEDRPLFRAAYEGRPPTTMERAQRLAAASDRLDQAFRPVPSLSALAL